ncbi:MAG: phosphodiester glycosidase family protein [Pseudomonadota bacterium]|nr:phosphodiester glycosidase family protein [Pseudomonadota bacterium]
MFHIDGENDFWPGLGLRRIAFRHLGADPFSGALEARSAFGRAVIVDPRRWEVVLWPFFDLINASKGNDPRLGCCPEPAVNLGATVRDLMDGARRESAAGGPYEPAVRRCVLACNTVHANFVRPNGFVVCNHVLVAKPAGYDALGLDCDAFMPLHGSYTALLLDDHGARVESVRLDAGCVVPPLPAWAVSGPALVRNGADVSRQLPFRPRPGTSLPADFAARHPGLRLPPGPTRGDEVNFPPPLTKTSFTAFGVDPQGRLICVSLFEGQRGEDGGGNLGVSVHELAALLGELGAVDAILGGGGADAQQFLRGDRPQHLTAPLRARPPGQGARAEVEGPRGLGAILGVLARP